MAPRARRPALILAAAGSGTRMGTDKLWVEISGRPLVAWTLDAVAWSGVFGEVVIVARPPDHAPLEALARAAGIDDPHLVDGGSRRQQSVERGVEECGDAAVICVHDAARPLCPPDLFRAVVQAAGAHGAATAAIPLVDSVKRVRGQQVEETLDRSTLVAVQTPQAFAAEVLTEAHRCAADDGALADDDSALVERLGRPVIIVRGDPSNLKVTRPADLVAVRALVAERLADGGPGPHGASRPAPG